MPFIDMPTHTDDGTEIIEAGLAVHLHQCTGDIDILKKYIQYATAHVKHTHDLDVSAIFDSCNVIEKVADMGEVCSLSYVAMLANLSALVSTLFLQNAIDDMGSAPDALNNNLRMFSTWANMTLSMITKTLAEDGHLYIPEVQEVSPEEMQAIAEGEDNGHTKH